MEIFGGKVFALTPSPQVTLNRGGLKLGRTVETIGGYDATKFGRDSPVNDGDIEVPKFPMLGDMSAIQLSTESIVRNSFTLGVIGVAWARPRRPPQTNPPHHNNIPTQNVDIHVSARQHTRQTAHISDI